MVVVNLGIASAHTERVLAEDGREVCRRPGEPTVDSLARVEAAALTGTPAQQRDPRRDELIGVGPENERAACPALEPRGRRRDPRVRWRGGGVRSRTGPDAHPGDDVR